MLERQTVRSSLLLHLGFCGCFFPPPVSSPVSFGGFAWRQTKFLDFSLSGTSALITAAKNIPGWVAKGQELAAIAQRAGIPGKTGAGMVTAAGGKVLDRLYAVP